MYSTDDLVLRRADGMVDFVGRRDRQVKIRGHRVELAEVEKALLTLDGVSEAAAIAVDNSTTMSLRGCCVLRSGSAITEQQLIEQARTILPRFMVPDQLMVVPALPTT